MFQHRPIVCAGTAYVSSGHSAEAKAHEPSDPGFIFLFASEAVLTACLQAHGCPVPPVTALLPPAPPLTSTEKPAVWLDGLIVGSCSCTRSTIVPEIMEHFLVLGSRANLQSLCIHFSELHGGGVAVEMEEGRAEPKKKCIFKE